jgi:hypothetical protein
VKAVRAMIDEAPKPEKAKAVKPLKPKIPKPKKVKPKDTYDPNKILEYLTKEPKVKKVKTQDSGPLYVIVLPKGHTLK